MLIHACVQARDEENSELYSNYRPARLVDGRPHPDPIVETASLAGVSPPKPKYQHHLQVTHQLDCCSHAQPMCICAALKKLPDTPVCCASFNDALMWAPNVQVCGCRPGICSFDCRTVWLLGSCQMHRLRLWCMPSCALTSGCRMVCVH